MNFGVYKAAASLLLVLCASVFGAQVSDAQQWQLIDGKARDVGVGADGTVWVIGTGASQGGYLIYRRDGSTWTNVPGGAERIAVDSRGHAWVVNNAQAVFRHDGTQWVVVNGQARDVGIGANGTVWVIGNNPEAGGYAIYRSTDNGVSWTKIPGSAMRIAVDPAGNAWVVTNSNAIFRYDGTKWVQTPGAAKDVGVGADGAVWAIAVDSGIYRWDGSSWVKKTGGAEQISAGPGGVVWVVSAGGDIYRAQDTAAVAAAGPAAAAPVAGPTCDNAVDPNAYYQLSNTFLNEGRALSAAGGKLSMATAAQNDANQLWKFTPVPGRTCAFRITNAALGTGKAMDTSPTAPTIADSGSTSGQLWTLASVGNGLFRLSSDYQPAKSLDTYSDRGNDPFLGNTGYYSAQLWKLTARAAPVETTARTTTPGTTAAGIDKTAQ